MTWLCQTCAWELGLIGQVVALLRISKKLTRFPVWSTWFWVCHIVNLSMKKELRKHSSARELKYFAIPNKPQNEWKHTNTLSHVRPHGINHRENEQWTVKKQKFWCYQIPMKYQTQAFTKRFLERFFSSLRGFSTLFILDERRQCRKISDTISTSWWLLCHKNTCRIKTSNPVSRRINPV